MTKRYIEFPYEALSDEQRVALLAFAALDDADCSLRSGPAKQFTTICSDDPLDNVLSYLVKCNISFTAHLQTESADTIERYSKGLTKPNLHVVIIDAEAKRRICKNIKLENTDARV